jgi:hypothetical protein
MRSRITLLLSATCALAQFDASRVQVLHAVWSGAATNAAVSQKIVEFTTDGLNAAPARELWLPNSSAMGTQCTASGSASSDGYGTTTLDG